MEFEPTEGIAKFTWLGLTKNKASAEQFTMLGSLVRSHHARPFPEIAVGSGSFIAAPVTVLSDDPNAEAIPSGAMPGVKSPALTTALICCAFTVGIARSRTARVDAICLYPACTYLVGMGTRYAQTCLTCKIKSGSGRRCERYAWRRAGPKTFLRIGRGFTERMLEP